jgi:hypothetical protein
VGVDADVGEDSEAEKRFDCLSAACRKEAKKAQNGSASAAHKASLLLVRLASAASLVLSSYAFTTSALLVAIAQAAAFLLVPGAKRLSAKGEIGIVNDCGLDPGVCAEIDLASCGIEGLQVGDNVVIRSRFGR